MNWVVWGRCKFLAHLIQKINFQFPSFFKNSDIDTMTSVTMSFTVKTAKRGARLAHFL